MPTPDDAQPPARPRLGAIRWDAWEGGPITEQVERTLGPAAYHDRLPWFTEVLDSDQVHIDGGQQAIMDREIAFAQAGGLDYWAFLLYAEDSPMSSALQLYRNSAQRTAIDFCLIVHSTLNASEERWPAELERAVGLLREPGYVTVLGQRPLVYLFSGEQVRWDRWQMFLERALKDGLDPYLVYMGWNPQADWNRVQEHGFDAVSHYAFADPTNSYQDLTAGLERRYWQVAREAQVPYIPLISSGWDKRPRIDHPVAWEQGHSYHSQTVWADPARPEEFQAHVQRALAFIADNPAICPTGNAIIYAWNEHDEGGWIRPTLHPDGSPDTARLDALRSAIDHPA